MNINNLKVVTNPAVIDLIASYPELISKKLTRLRQLILETADEVESIKSIEETLKWGEPSYLVKKGSTVRMDWKKSTPDQYAIYFKCTSKLVETFKEVYRDTFTYSGNRAIIFKLDDSIPEKELKHCIKLALTYHTVKQLPLLGAAL